jgi:hypothetical protein
MEAREMAVSEITEVYANTLDFRGFSPGAGITGAP